MAESHDISLTEAERISILESTVRTNRLIIFIVTAALALFAIVTVVILVVQLMNPPSGFADASSYQEIIKEIKQLEDKNKSWHKQVDSLRLDLDNSQAAVFKTLFFEQEENYQLHLGALKQGMRDLAHMVPGSRTWLEIYNEKMDAALARSEARMKKLAQVKTSEQPSIEAVPLPTVPTPVNISN